MADQPAWQTWHDDSEPIRVGVSSCLLGRKVRFDGGHKRDRYLTDVIGGWVEWVSVCPEVEIGLGTPRPTIRLEGVADQPRLVEPKSGADLTERMREYSERRIDELQNLELDGYVLKRASPSCGMERVRVWNTSGMPDKSGVGIFAEVLLNRWPNLPVEEEGRLNDPVLRENFVERLFCRHRWRSLVRVGLTRSRLIAFHTAHKMLVRAHNEAGYRRLGKIVASFGRGSDAEIFAAYEDEFFADLKLRATAKRHTNVLQHAVGCRRIRSRAGGQEGAARTRRGLPPGFGASRGPGDNASTLRPPLRHRLSVGPDLSRAAPEGVDASQPRVTSNRLSRVVPSPPSGTRRPAHVRRNHGWSCSRRMSRCPPVPVAPITETVKRGRCICVSSFVGIAAGGVGSPVREMWEHGAPRAGWSGPGGGPRDSQPHRTRARKGR